MALTTEGKDTNTVELNLWPETLNDAVELVLSKLSPENLAELRNANEDRLVLFLHGLGTHIRRDCGLWQGNEKLIASACGGPAHPDDASMKIIEALWRRLQDKR